MQTIEPTLLMFRIKKWQVRKLLSYTFLRPEIQHCIQENEWFRTDKFVLFRCTTKKGKHKWFVVTTIPEQQFKTLYDLNKKEYV